MICPTISARSGVGGGMKLYQPQCLTSACWRAIRKAVTPRCHRATDETPLGAGNDVHPERCMKLDLQRFVELLDAWDDIVGPKLPRLRYTGGRHGPHCPRGVQMMDMLPDTVTTRPRVEMRHEQEASYQLLFLHHPTPMWFMDEVTLAFLEVNEAAIRRYGYTRDEFSRMTMQDLRLPEEVPLVLSHSQRSPVAQDRTGGELPNMWRHRTQNGTIIDVDIVRSAVVFRGRKAILAMAHDATERVRGEAALRKSYEELDRQVQERTSALARANATLQAEVVERARAEASTEGPGGAPVPGLGGRANGCLGVGSPDWHTAVVHGAGTYARLCPWQLPRHV